MRKIKRVVHSSEQDLDIVIALILFQERLPSRQIWHEYLVQKITLTNVPWVLLKVNHAPSLRMGKAENGSWLSQGHQKDIARTSAIGPNVFITHLILPSAFPHVLNWPIGAICFVALLA